jgi:hypothetical protein
MATPPSPVETNSLLREVSESVRSRSSSTNSNDFVVDADTQNALSQIKTKFTGAKCDSEGFYQHEGECWNDAIHMVFLFSDGLKEVVQEKLANNEVDINFIPRESIPRIIDEYAKYRGKDVSRAPPDLSPKQIIESLVFYLKFLKNRFARHYTMESERRENELCTLNKNPIHLLHVKGKNAELAAIFGNPTKNPHNNITIEKYKKNQLSGANHNQVIYLVNILLYTFFPGIDSLNSYMNYWDFFSTNYSYSIQSIPDPRNIISILFASKDHASCFYTCGDNDFFYEDNYGPFLFPWRKILFTEPLARKAARDLVVKLKKKKLADLEKKFGRYYEYEEETKAVMRDFIYGVDITDNKTIESIIFSSIWIDSINISNYYPILKTKDNKLFTFYNNVEYKISDGKNSYNDDKVKIVVNYENHVSFNMYTDKYVKGKSMLPIYLKDHKEKRAISNKGFIFRNSARLEGHAARVHLSKKAENAQPQLQQIANDLIALDQEIRLIEKEYSDAMERSPTNLDEVHRLEARKENLYKKQRKLNILMTTAMEGGGSIRKNKRKTAKRKSYRRKRTTRSRRLS